MKLYYLHKSKMNQDNKIQFQRKNIVNIFELFKLLITKAKLLEKSDILDVLAELEDGMQMFRNAVNNGKPLISSIKSKPSS